MLYRRLDDLREDTQFCTDAEAAVKFLKTLESQRFLHFQVLNKVFQQHGSRYTLRNVYEIAEELQVCNAMYQAQSGSVYDQHNERAGTSHTGASSGRDTGGRTTTAGQGSTTKSAHAATVVKDCNYCGSRDHLALQCQCPRENLYCLHCQRTSHVEAVCYSKHPERRTWRSSTGTSTEGSGAAQASVATTTTATSAGIAAAPGAGKSKTARSKEKLRRQVAAMTAEIQTLSTTGAGGSKAVTTPAVATPVVSVEAQRMNALVAEVESLKERMNQGQAMGAIAPVTSYASAPNQSVPVNAATPVPTTGSQAIVPTGFSYGGFPSHAFHGAAELREPGTSAPAVDGFAARATPTPGGTRNQRGSNRQGIPRTFEPMTPEA